MISRQKPLLAHNVYTNSSSGFKGQLNVVGGTRKIVQHKVFVALVTNSELNELISMFSRGRVYCPHVLWKGQSLGYVKMNQ